MSTSPDSPGKVQKMQSKVQPDAQSSSQTPPQILTKPDRPSVLGGITVKTHTGCGNMYVQLNWFHGRLFEVFATLGKGGGCAVCQSEAITRGVTVGLKYGIPLSEYLHQLRGIRCPTPVPFPREKAVLSCPDALAKVLERYGTLPVSEVVKLLLGANGHSPEAGSEDEEAEVMAHMSELALERQKAGL